MPAPQIEAQLVKYLDVLFKPVTDTKGTIDIREIDYKSGQASVVAFLKSQMERQVSNGRIGS